MALDFALQQPLSAHRSSLATIKASEQKLLLATCSTCVRKRERPRLQYKLLWMGTWAVLAGIRAINLSWQLISLDSAIHVCRCCAHARTMYRCAYRVQTMAVLDLEDLFPSFVP